MTTTPIRVLVVDDSITVRKQIVAVLSAQPGIEVVGEASDGKAATDMCCELRPSVVTLDMVLPVMSGLAATEMIMAYCPTPILVVSSSLNRGELFHTYDALKAGAVDVLEKPSGDETDATWEERLVQAVKMVSRIKVITHPRARLSGFTRAVGAPPAGPAAGAPTAAPANDPDVRAGQRSIVAIGASTGGPGAVVEILRALPASFDLPIALCVHIGEPFGVAFADWLDGLLPRPVAYARDGETVASMKGRVVMAPPGAHLAIRRGRAEVHAGPPRHSCIPSVDVLFESVAESFGSEAVGCLLTGMGRDGASGLLAIRQAGGLTFAQDEATSVVYGMPREALLLGAATHVLPLGAFAQALAQVNGKPERSEARRS